MAHTAAQGTRSKPLWRRILNWVGLLIGVLIGLVLVLAAYIAFQVWRSTPEWEGERALSGLEAPVTIERDVHGIPHIKAGTWNDAYFALGWLHAQDRLWQMEINRRLGQGRMAEVAGSLALEVDVNFRALRLEAQAKSSYAALSETARGRVDAYTKGVNAFLETSDTPLPPEFQLLFHKPEAWEPHHSLLMLKMVGILLSSNAYDEALRMQLAEVFDSEQIRAIMEGSTDAHPTALPEDQRAEGPSVRPSADKLRRADLLPEPPEGASNNWVLSGSRTKSGKPILANDPHLGLTSPSVWYLVNMVVGDERAVGGTMAGVPTVLIGHNDHVAVGLTTTRADTQDLFLEKLVDGPSPRYAVPDGALSFKTYEEEFRVRFGSTERRTIRWSRHGPVLPILQDAAPEGHVYALAWTLLEFEDRTLDAAYGMMDARTVESMLAALADYVGPVQSMVLADDQGSIGFITPGRIPIRKDGCTTAGLVPAEGWTGACDWVGTIPHTELPQALNPPRGYAFSANARIVDDSYPYLIAGDWEHTWRDNRLESLLAGDGVHSAETSKRWQADVFNPMAEAFLPVMLQRVPRTDDTTPFLDALAEWDYEMRADAAEPLLFTAWYRQFVRLVIADEAGEKFADRLWAPRTTLMMKALKGEDGAEAWCDDTATPETETCALQLGKAFELALGDLSSRFGPKPSGWAWGRAHTALHRHRELGGIPVVGGLFNRADPTPGGDFTLNRGRIRYASEQPFANIHASGLRFIIDFAKPDEALFMMSTGPSGHPLSDYYDSLNGKWAEVEYITLPRSGPAQPIATTVLAPKE